MTEGGEQDDDVVASNPDPASATVGAAVAPVWFVSCLFVGDNVTSAKSVGKAPSHHEAGFTSDWG